METRKTRIDVRQIGKHSRDCRATQAFNAGDWHTVWGPLDRSEPTVFTTRALHKPKRKDQRGVHTYCLQFICNSTNCEAKLLVRADAALVAVRAPSTRRGES